MSKKKVFISYSRSDGIGFAEDLKETLIPRGIIPLIDHNDISPGDEWKKKLEKLILQSDAVAFVITQGALESEVCEWEIEKTIELGKRLIPLIPFSSSEKCKIPEKLSNRNYIYFYKESPVPSSGFPDGCNRLINELEIDNNWSDQHTIYLKEASEWYASDREEDYLLIGKKLSKALKWVDQQPPKDTRKKYHLPEISELLLEFIESSQKLDLKKQKENLKRKKQDEEKNAQIEQYKKQFENKKLDHNILSSASDLHGVKYLKDDDGLPRLAIIPTKEGFYQGSKDDDCTGRSNERPQRYVTFTSNFALSIYPITVREWNFAVENGFKAKKFEADEELPVHRITWMAAKMYCHWLSEVTGKPYRLPSESEWEYACRAGTNTTYYFGNKIERQQAKHQIKFFEINHLSGIDVVGKCPSNAFGLYDMHGNVWEWVEDDYHSSYKNAPTDGSAWLASPRKNYKVARGGCYASGPRHLRSARRAKVPPVPDEHWKFGFRVALTISDE